jgi:hypothetical protein
VKITALYDEQGNIAAASIPGDNSDEPIPGKGERLGEFEIPREAAELEIADILQRFHVDVAAEVLKPR